MYQFYHWRQEQRKPSICGKKSLKIQSSNEKVQKKKVQKKKVQTKKVQKKKVQKKKVQTKKVQKKKDKETNNDLQNTT
jgi:hypothetical protein